MHRYKELNVCKKAMDLSFLIGELVKEFPSKEMFGLVSQIRRCSMSIALNIAEGAGRNTNGEFRQFLGIAEGSAFELEAQGLLSEPMGFVSGQDSTRISDDAISVSNMIFKLKQSLKS